MVCTTVNTLLLICPFLFIDLPNIQQDGRWNAYGSLLLGIDRRNPDMQKVSDSKGTCIQSDNTILLADSKNHRIVEYIEDVRPENIFGDGKKASEPYEFHQICRPRGVALDRATNSMIICGSDHQRMLWSYFDSTTDYKIVVNKVACYGVAVDAKSNIDVSDTKTRTVHRYRPGDQRGVIVAGGRGHGQGSRKNRLNHPT